MITDESKEPEVSSAAKQGHRQLRRLGPLAWLLTLAAAGLLGYFIYSGITARVAAESSLKTATEQAAIPIVNVIHPSLTAPAEEIALPGNTQAYTDTPVYARTSGYLRRWYFDIGAHVKKGQLLAEIETPEIDHQLQQARADLATAQANLHLAETTAARWQFLLKSNSVSKQETDEKIGDFHAKKAIVDAAAANVSRLEDLQSFQNVYAPFDGIITARNIDVGSLIDSGANTPGKELFHIAATNRLRVYVAIPEVYSRAARTDTPAYLTLDEYPGRKFYGRIARNSNSIDPSSRTLLTEVDINNPDGRLLPGAYVFVHLKLPGQIRSVTVPSNTLLFRSEGLRVGVVRDGRTELRPIVIGRDYGDRVEVVSGLRPRDQVILDPADSLIDGEHVRITGGAVAR